MNYLFLVKIFENVISQYRELFRLNDVRSLIFQRKNGIVSLRLEAKNYLDSKNLVYEL